MGEIRRSRDARPERRCYRVTERDLRILRAVGRMKLAKTSQLTALFFGDPRTCSRRLAKLVALGLLVVFVLVLNSENLYALTERGRDLLVEHGVDASELHLAKSVRRPDLAHLLMVNDLRVALVKACRERGELAVDLFLADPDLRRAAGTSLPFYVPDALVRLSTPHGEVRIVVEVDTGTESPRWFAARKARVLAALARGREACWGLPWPWHAVLLAPSARRVYLLAGPVVAEGAGDLLLGGELPRLKTGGALAPAFATMAEVHAAIKGTPIAYGRTLLADPRVP